MPIQDLKNEQLANLQANYLKRNATEGAIYTLAEVKIEMMRRLPNPFGVRETAVKIVEMAQASSDGLLTYGELWKAFRPNEPWKGNASGTIMANALGRVAAYCVDNKLPILTTLVVRTSGRKLSPEAIENIYAAAKEWGVDTGPDAKAFVTAQTEGARKLTIANLPAAT